MHNLTITSNKNVSHEIHKITAAVDPNTPLSFKAGQFCMIHIPTQNNTIPRAYSLAHDPADPNNIILYIKLRRNEDVIHYASPYFENCKSGDKLQMDPPTGFMTVPNPLPEKIVYIATCTGIAPFLSHLHELSTHYPNQHIDIIFGCRCDAGMFAQNELTQFKQKLLNLNIITTITRPTKQWTGKTGRVTQYIDQYTPDQNNSYFLCGNKQMIIDTRKILTEKGIPPTTIKFEIFA